MQSFSFINQVADMLYVDCLETRNLLLHHVSYSMIPVKSSKLLPTFLGIKLYCKCGRCETKTG